jgi:translation elongation factor EF-Tu-like GTPase
VFVNKMDVADHELVDLVVLDIHELLRQHGYVDTPIVKGSALGALRFALREGGRTIGAGVVTAVE